MGVDEVNGADERLSLRTWYKEHGQGGIALHGPDDGLTLLGLGTLAGLLLMLVSQQFAAHVDGIYASLQALAWVEFSVALLSSAAQSGLGRAEAALRCVAVSLVALAAATCLSTAWWAYPPDLVSTGGHVAATEFWCGLTDDQWQMAILHRMAALAGFGVGLLLLAGAALLPAACMVGAELGHDMRPWERWSALLGSAAPVLVGAILVAAACYAHTQEGRQAWQQWTQTHQMRDAQGCGH